MRRNIEVIFVVIFALIASITCSVLCMESQKINVIKTSKLMDALKSIDENTLLILDLDGTLWRPKQILGNNAWA
jgi:predicted enzyme involved in methoxymalonyl-ACP biosynthesis